MRWIPIIERKLFSDLSKFNEYKTLILVKMKKALFLTACVLVLPGFFRPDESFIDSLKTKIDFYLKNIGQGDLYIALNQSKYVPGDTVALSVRYSQEWSKVLEKQIVYLKLIDAIGEQTWQGKVMLKKGKSTNYFVLPNEIDPGIYQLVAFTDRIILSNPELAFSTTLYVSGKKSFSKSNKSLLTIRSECYSSVNGLQNRFVLFGKAFEKISIKSGTTTLTQVQLDSAGFGVCSLVPPANDSLVAVLADNIIPFPKRSSEGFQFFFDERDQSVEVTASKSASTPGKKIYFIVAGGKGLVFSKEINYSSTPSVNFQLPEDVLADGKFEAVLIDTDYNIWAKRNLYFKAPKKLNVSVQYSSDSLKIDHAFNIDLKITDNRGVFLPAIADISIANSALIPEETHPTFFHGDLATINRRAIASIPFRFNWDKVFNPSPMVPFQENRMHLRGTVFINNRPAPDSTHVLFFLKRNLIGYDAYTDAKGNFKMPFIFDFYGQEDLFYCATYKGKDLTEAVFDFKSTVPEFLSTEQQTGTALNLEDTYYQYSAKKKIVEGSYAFFQRKKNDETLDYNEIVEDELQGADIIFKTQDYVLFPTMAELIREALKSVDHRVVKGRDVVRVYTSNYLTAKQTCPLLVIDGQVSKDAERFLELNPENVITIKIVKDAKKIARFGELSKYGVIIVKTKSSPPKKETTMQVDGFLETYIPKQPTIINSRIPDLRPSLCWNPAFQISSDPTSLTFRTSNDIGDFAIIVKGFTSTGTPFHHRQNIKVHY